MPVSFILTASAFISPEANFEFKRTLQTGEFIFTADAEKFEFDGGAATYGNIIVFADKDFNNYSLLSHEIIHIYQYYDFNFVNTYLNKPINKLSEKSDVFSSINNLFYFDIQGVILRPLYLLENRNRNCYYDNFFENEAGFYSNTINCD